MSERNVEIARRLYDAVARRDFDALNVIVSPDARLRTLMGSVSGRTYGRGEAGDYFADADQVWETLDQTVESVTPVDADRVIAAVRMVGKGRASGVSINQVVGVVITVRDGQVADLQGHASVSEAFEAVQTPPGDAQGTA